VETREEVLADLRTRMSNLMERAKQLKMRSAAPSFQVSPAAAPCMEKAIQCANRALVFDEAANFSEAATAYLEAVEHLRRAAQRRCLVLFAVMCVCGVCGVYTHMYT
jgi:hypothetical protein